MTDSRFSSVWQQNEIERLRFDMMLKNRRIDELAAEVDAYKWWLHSNGFDWEQVRHV